MRRSFQLAHVPSPRQVCAAALSTVHSHEALHAPIHGRHPRRKPAELSDVVRPANLPIESRSNARATRLELLPSGSLVPQLPPRAWPYSDPILQCSPMLTGLLFHA